MPCDYSKYAKNWKTEIRPRILKRAGNKCERCNAVNHSLVFRGVLNGIEVYQNIEGEIFSYPDGSYLGADVYAEIEPISGDPSQKAVKIVLTIAHLDHNIENNKDENLASLCQKCHVNHDKEHHLENARKTREKKKGLVNLFG